MPHFLRSLTRAPGFTVAAVLMAAIGIALFALGLAVVDAALWRPLPIGNDALVLYSTHTSAREIRDNVRWSFPRLLYVREHAKAVELVTSWSPATLALSGTTEPQRVDAEFVSQDYFDLLGIRPRAGRAFSADEDVPGAPQPVVLISEAFQRRLALLGDPLAPGSTLRLNDHIVTVIGVLPAAFRGLTNRAELWLPTPMAPVLTYPEYLTTDQDFITLLARRKQGVNDVAVQREIASLANAAQQVQLTDDARPGLTVGGRALPLGAARLRREGTIAARLALAGTALLFLLTLANLTALLLGRAVARRRETAVRLAIGATWGRVWRASAFDGASLVLIGAALALVGLTAWLSASGGVDPIGNVGRGAFDSFSAVGVGARLIACWVLTALIALVVTTVVPAWWAMRHARLDHLRDGSHGAKSTGVSLRRPGIAAGILAIEAALAMLLIAAAGQLLESYRRMQRVDLGIDPDHVLTFELQPPESAVPPERAVAFIDRVLESVRAVPGVQYASVDGGAPLAGSASGLLHIVGRPDDPVAGAPPVLLHYVGAEHLSTLGIPLRAGRALTDGDREGAPRVVLISESAARRFFPDGNAIGQRIWFDGSVLTTPDSSGEIVGIVGDVKYDPLLRERTTASFYTPYRQFTYGWRVYFVRVAGDPCAMTRVIADAVHRVAPDLPLLNVRPLSDIVTASSATSRAAARGTGVLGGLGLLLAVCGIWAIVAHATAQRARDMAIRLAHGASAGRVIRLVLVEGLTWPAAGLLAGTILTFAGSGVLGSLLYDVRPGDPVILTGAALAFLLAAAGACLWPAWRASCVDPIGVLRSD